VGLPGGRVVPLGAGIAVGWFIGYVGLWVALFIFIALTDHT
jgi:hypothetical protein